MNRGVNFSCCSVLPFCLRFIPMRSFCRASVIAALMLSIGLHWTVLQSAAWVGMIVSYAQDGDVSEAIEKTFDGQHPCALCKLVEQGTAKEKQPQKKAPVSKKLDMTLVAVERIAVPPPGHPDFVVLSERPAQRRPSPSVPPPRAV